MITTKKRWPAVKVIPEPLERHGHLELDAGPKTCAALREHMSFKRKVARVPWIGERLGAPLGSPEFGVGVENIVYNSSFR